MLHVNVIFKNDHKFRQFHKSPQNPTQVKHAVQLHTLMLPLQKRITRFVRKTCVGYAVVHYIQIDDQFCLC